MSLPFDDLYRLLNVQEFLKCTLLNLILLATPVCPESIIFNRPLK